MQASRDSMLFLSTLALSTLALLTLPLLALLLSTAPASREAASEDRSESLLAAIEYCANVSAAIGLTSITSSQSFHCDRAGTAREQTLQRP